MEEERFVHEDKIRSLKTQFLKDKRQLEESSETRIREMAVHANKVGTILPYGVTFDPYGMTFDPYTVYIGDVIGHRKILPCFQYIDTK